MNGIKSGVDVLGLKPEAFIILWVAGPIFEAYGVDCIVTSGSEGKHSAKHSKHYTGMGIDFRTRDLSEDKQRMVANLLDTQLGPDFYVRLESNHIHAHYSPVHHG